MINAYSIGVSVLNVGQRNIDLVGQNIANSTTAGYHRQTATLQSTVAGSNQGTGVKIGRFVRHTAPALRTSILSSNSEAGRLTARLNTQRQAETLFATGDGAIDGRLEQFFNQVAQLSTRPEDASQRRIAVDNAVSLSSRFNELSGDLTRLQDNVFREIDTTVKQVNDLTPKIAELNTRIAEVEASGDQANDLRDQRDQLVTQLSELVDVRVTEQENGIVNIMGANAPLVVGQIATPLETFVNASGNVVVRVPGTTNPLAVDSGKLAGLTTEYNTTIPGQKARLDTLAGKIIERVNAIVSTGLTQAGPSTFATATTPVPNPATSLAAQNLKFPAQAGTLYVSVTDQGTGGRSLVPVAIDPATQSLTDVANAVTTATGGQVAGSVDPAGLLRFTAQTGYAFDFAGRLPSTPNAVAMNGTSVPSVTGTYSGANNDTFSFQVVGSGTVGTTSGLTLEVRNSANTVVASLNVGQGYKPGDPLLVKDGITVRLAAGTTNAGTFSVPVTADPDTADLLPALGVNGLFTGVDASSIAVRSDIAADASKFPTSRSGQPGETSNLARLSALRDEKALASGTQTFREFFGDTVGGVGTEVSGLDTLQTAQINLQRNLEAQEQSVVGVDINEEMVDLLRFQRMVEAGSRYLSVVNRALDAIMEIST